MPCVYENIGLLDDNFAEPTLKADYRHHIAIPPSTTFVGKPHIAYTLVRDAVNYAKESQYSLICADDYEQHITLGVSCVLYSNNDLGFANQPVRLTICKINERPAGRITIGNNVTLQGTSIVCYEAVTIEDDVLFGPQVTIMDSSGHPITGRGTPDEAARTLSSPVTIKQGAWIGLGATILKGVTIGRNAIVSANSVVYQDVPDNAIVIGNPANVVKILDIDSEQPHGDINNAQLSVAATAA